MDSSKEKASIDKYGLNKKFSIFSKNIPPLSENVSIGELWKKTVIGKIKDLPNNEKKKVLGEFKKTLNKFLLAVAFCRHTIFHTLMENPDIPIDEIFEFVEKFQCYGFDQNLRYAFHAVIVNFYKNRNTAREIFNCWQSCKANIEKINFFKQLLDIEFSDEDLSKIEVNLGPMNLEIVIYDQKIWETILKKQNLKNIEGIHGFVKRCNLEENYYVYALIASPTTENSPSLEKIKLHEYLHLQYYLLRETFAENKELSHHVERLNYSYFRLPNFEKIMEGLSNFENKDSDLDINNVKQMVYKRLAEQSLKSLLSITKDEIIALSYIHDIDSIIEIYEKYGPEPIGYDTKIKEFLENHRNDELLKNIFEEFLYQKFQKIVMNALNALKSLYEAGYPISFALHLLHATPLIAWPKVVKRILENPIEIDWQKIL